MPSPFGETVSGSPARPVIASATAPPPIVPAAGVRSWPGPDRVRVASRRHQGRVPAPVDLAAVAGRRHERASRCVVDVDGRGSGWKGARGSERCLARCRSSSARRASAGRAPRVAADRREQLVERGAWTVREVRCRDGLRRPGGTRATPRGSGVAAGDERERRRRVDVSDVEPPGEEPARARRRACGRAPRARTLPSTATPTEPVLKPSAWAPTTLRVDAAVAPLEDLAEAVDEEVVADVVPAVRLARGRAGSPRTIAADSAARVAVGAGGVVDDREARSRWRRRAPRAGSSRRRSSRCAGTIGGGPPSASVRRDAGATGSTRRRRAAR